MKRNLIYKYICGVDEAGRGALAGPVFAGAVVLDKTIKINGIKDSKLLTRNYREDIFLKIKNQSITWAFGKASVREIYDLNIRRASLLAMKRAILKLSIKPDLLLIDGLDSVDINIDSKTIIEGDKKIESISAASIIAKVCRDNHMEIIHKKYPMYSFEKHKGYGTKYHLEMLKEFGACKEHRKNYKPIKNLI